MPRLILFLILLTTPTPPPQSPYATPTPGPAPLATNFQARWADGRALLTWDGPAGETFCVRTTDERGFALRWIGCGLGEVRDGHAAPGERYDLLNSVGVVVGRARLGGRVWLPMVTA